MAFLMREAACWAVLALMSARLLVSPEQLSTQELLVAASYGAGLLVVGWLLWYAVTLYCVPYNRVKAAEDFGPIRDDSTKNLGSRRCAAVNEVRRRQKEAAMPPPYPNAWFAALESRELRPGQVRPLDILGQHLVLFRTRAGEARVLDGICPHLGADLAQGAVRGEDIECPFHKWLFNGQTGQVECVPYTKQSKSSLKHFSVTSWPVFEANGVIHVWHHAEGEPPSWYPPTYEQIASGHYRYRGRTEHLVAAHIQDLPENGADPAHLAAIHEKIFADGNDLEERSRWGWIRHNWTASWQPDAEHRHQAFVHMQMTFVLLGKLHFYHNDITVRQVGPGLVYINFKSPLGSGVIQQLVTPVGDLRQKVIHTIHWDRSYGLGPLIAKFYLMVEANQFERDVRIWNNKDHLPQPGLVREDATILKYRRWFSQFYSESSRRPLRPVDALEL
ncbi:cholesterol 7-desaturase nvd-like [Amphibalanus amphitrite]|uniref:cholesterol 7-desaturase nvd-like n=1 Tax=Amphibalanus amphitrite TaxID=1232801 RepID=UPI001C916ED9|nr:cholesterol 7-desaturase nvd-like [Amphibalanus amphitrite]XP_043201448.1 cholesterol 7-desaturase nvd-like [Amphibalanus amphitrite]